MTTTPMAMTSSTSYDEILSTTPPVLDEKPSDHELTTYLLLIFPFYLAALSWNFLSIYSICFARIYRQYLTNILLTLVCLGTLLNVHGQIFLILLRWTNNQSITTGNCRLCSSSIYLRDSGFILLHMHIFLMAIERIVANLKRQSTNIYQHMYQRAHRFLIILSIVCLILAFLVPIYPIKNHSYSLLEGLCIPQQPFSYRKYVDWILFGLGHAFIWPALILLIVFFLRTTSPSSFQPANRATFFLCLITGINLFFGTLFDDHIGIHQMTSNSKISLMNFRDFISILHKCLIGIVFFLCRTEIRSWLYQSLIRFRINRKEEIIPQMLDIRDELDDTLPTTTDGNINFRTAN